MIPKIRSIAVAAAALAVLTANGVAQTPTTPPTGDEPLATLLSGGVMGELLAINVPRSQEEIGRLLDEARRLEQTAVSEIETCRRMATEAEGRTKIMKGELQVTEARRDAAKKNKDQAAAAEHGVSVEKQSRELKYLTLLQAALNADADRLEAVRVAAAATARSLELELDVVRKQAEIGVGTPSPETVQQYRTLLRGMLESQRDAASKVQISADKKKKLAEHRLKQLAALAKL